MSVLSRRQFMEKSPITLGLLLARQNMAADVSRRAQRLHMGAQTGAWGVPIEKYDDLLRILDTLAQLGYEGFETNYKSLTAQFATAAACRKDFEARHMRLSALYCSGRLLDKDKIPGEIESLRRTAGSIAEMGGRHQIIGSDGFPRPGGQLDVEVMRVWTDALNRLGTAVKAEGVQLCYHNHRQEFEGDPTPMSFLLRQTDPERVRLNFDVGHPVGLISPAAFSAEHFRRIAIYHLKDVKLVANSNKRVHTKPGAGQVDLKGVVAPLLKGNWSGWLEFEEDGNYPHPIPNPEETFREDREYLRQITGV